MFSAELIVVNYVKNVIIIKFHQMYLTRNNMKKIHKHRVSINHVVTTFENYHFCLNFAWHPHKKITTR